MTTEVSLSTNEVFEKEAPKPENDDRSNGGRKELGSSSTSTQGESWLGGLYLVQGNLLLTLERKKTSSQGKIKRETKVRDGLIREKFRKESGKR